MELASRIIFYSITVLDASVGMCLTPPKPTKVI